MSFKRAEDDWLRTPEGKRKVVGECYICDKEIFQGELIYTDGFERCCMNCINNMSAKQFINDFLREDFTEAEAYYE